MGVNVAWVALSLTHRIGGKTFQSLREHFDGDLAAILVADEQSLQQVPGVGATIARAITQIDLQAVASAVKRWQKAGVNILTSDDFDYPPPLLSLDDAPPTIFVRGVLPDLRQVKAYAIVGTRQPTAQALITACNLAIEITRRGHVVVSGLADGIDTTAHIGALSDRRGITVAVLGSGVLNIYPPTNAALAQTILDRSGALLCEVAPDLPVSVAGLVARNRIITGLCAGVIVVETGMDGGAMHAARFARAQGKPLYTVISDALGNRDLLANGALPIAPDLAGFPL